LEGKTVEDVQAQINTKGGNNENIFEYLKLNI
jgi:hypothetical protein